MVNSLINVDFMYYSKDKYKPKGNQSLKPYNTFTNFKRKYIDSVFTQMVEIVSLR